MVRELKCRERRQFSQAGTGIGDGDMVGRIVGLVSCLLCAFPFGVISVYNKEGDEPMNFWSGDTSLKDKVKDVKGYNAEMAGLYRNCALFFLVSGILFMIFPAAGIILLIVGCSAGIYVAYRVYKKILEKYS